MKLLDGVKRVLRMNSSFAADEKADGTRRVSPTTVMKASVSDNSLRSVQADMKAELTTIETLAIRFLIALALVIAAYAGSVGWQAATVIPSPAETMFYFSKMQRGFVFTLGLYIALLATAVIGGGLLGFLFGIPRLLQTARTATTAIGEAAEQQQRSLRGPAFAGNTNLEEISDWLTKIIVGLGLTQAGNIHAGFITAKTEFVMASMGGTPGSEAMFATVLISGTVLGFLFFYLETRTRVTLLLVNSDHLQNRSYPETVLERVTKEADPERTLRQASISAAQGSTEPKPASNDDKQITKIPLATVNGATELATWAMAQMRMRNFAAAEAGLRKAISEWPDRPELLTALAAVKNWAGRPEEANRILDQAALQFPANAKVLRDKLLASLYLAPPESFTQAITTAEQLKATDASAATDPFVSLWTACAYGQKYKHVESDTEKADAEDQALKAVTALVANSRSDSLVRRTLREVFDPIKEKSDPGENDLEVFKTNPAFVKEVYKT